MSSIPSSEPSCDQSGGAVGGAPRAIGEARGGAGAFFISISCANSPESARGGADAVAAAGAPGVCVPEMTGVCVCAEVEEHDHVVPGGVQAAASPRWAGATAAGGRAGGGRAGGRRGAPLL